MQAEHSISFSKTSPYYFIDDKLMSYRSFMNSEHTVIIFLCHTLGGPFLPNTLPSFLSNLANHAKASTNISSGFDSELVSQLVISASNEFAFQNMFSMSVT